MKHALIFVFKLSASIVLLLIFVGQHVNESRTYTEIEIPRDTTLITCNGSKYTVPVELVSNQLNNFIEFSNEYCNQTLSYEFKEQLDTTGDGEKETVISQVQMIGNKVHIKNSILKSSGEPIWHNELLVDSTELASNWASNSGYTENLPLSAFYLGVNESKFTGALDKSKSDYDRRKKELLRLISGGIFNSHDLETLYNSQLSKWIDNYNGMYILDLNQGMRVIHIWDENKNQFVPLSIS